MYNRGTGAELSFDWDDANIEHIARHDVKPEEAEQALRNDPLEYDYDVVEDEERWTSIGHTNKLRILKVVWTLRGMTIRIVTTLDATKREARGYLHAKGIAR
jgi:uncharacterized DUF497 family protein